MKYLKFATAIIALCLFSCSNNEHTESNVKADTTETAKASENLNDKQEIQDLIRKVLNWSAAKNAIDLLPAIADSKDSIYIGFDKEKLTANLEKLKATNFFSAGFIENYNQIILTLDKGLRNKEFDKWQMGDLPTFGFANDADPWCNCQDVPYDKPNAWDLVEVVVINLNNEKGELYWKWGKPKSDWGKGWKEFKYKFAVEKENGAWKVSYMQGFDFKEGTRKD